MPNDNIVKLVFQSVSTGNGWDNVKTKGVELLKNTHALVAVAPKVSAAFGEMGQTIGAVFSNILRGGIWGAFGSIATIGVQKIFARFEARAKAAEEYQKALQKSIEDRYAAMATQADQMIKRIDVENAKIKEQVDLQNRMLKATLELRRAEALRSGDTATATGIDEELAQFDGKAAVGKAESNVYAAERRVNTAKLSLDAARDSRKLAQEELWKAEEALREASKPVTTVMQSSAGAFSYTSRRDTSREEEAVKQARLQLELAEKTSDQLNDAYKAELKAFESARNLLKVIQKEVEAAEAKRVAEREAAQKKSDEAEAAAAKKKAKDEEDLANELAAQQIENNEREQREQAEQYLEEERRGRAKMLAEELQRNKQIADDLRRRIEEAWRKADEARKAFADRGNLDLGGEARARRMEEANNKRLKAVAERLKARGIDIDNPKRRLSREEEAARRWMIQDREKDKNVKELAKVNATLEIIATKLDSTLTI